MPDAIERLRDGQQAERLGVLGRALEAYQEAAEASSDPDVVAEALVRQAGVHRACCEWEQALHCARAAQDTARSARLHERHAEAMNAEALVHMARGDFAAALPLLTRVTREARDLRLRGIAMQNTGTILAQQGQLAAAEQSFAESYACFRECGYERGQAIALNNQGRVALDRGDHEQAETIIKRALAAARDVDDGELVAVAMVNLAEAILPRDATRAESMACSALGHFQGSRNSWRMVECLRLLGTIHEHRGARTESARCYERALEIAREIGAKVEITALEGCVARLGESPTEP